MVGKSPQGRDLSLGVGGNLKALGLLRLRCGRLRWLAGAQVRKNCDERLFATVLRKGKGRVKAGGEGVERKGVSDSPNHAGPTPNL